jgi:hypothetical protein
MRDVFPYVLAIDVARYTNTILVGSQTPLSAEALRANLDRYGANASVRQVAEWSLQEGHMRAISPGGMVFTDDRAPVEMVIDEMIFDAARELTGGKP